MPQISEAVLKVLDSATIDGALLTLNGTLDRKLYVETNKVLEAAGGRWNKKAKAHIFDGLAMDTIEPIILTGEYRLVKQDFGQFDTPKDLAAEIVNAADISPGMVILEPSIGLGNLAFEAERVGGIVSAYEIDLTRAAKANDRLPKVSVKVANFLNEPAEPIFDRVVMNPPFAKQDDIRHVLHAFKFLKPDGKLVAIMSSSVLFRDNNLTAEFREFVAAHGASIDRLPEGSFKSSGTSVNTCVVKLAA